MSEQQEPPTIPRVLWALANLVFKREAVLIGASVAVLLGVGAGGAVWAQAKLDGGVAPVAERVGALEAQALESKHHAAVEAEDIRRRMAAVERSVYETALNVRLLLEERRIQPVTLDLAVPSRDGGR